MNKIAIPALLVATVMVAGAFAFMPVEQASTVHSSGTINVATAGITSVTTTVDTTFTGGGADVEYHRIILESGVAFTLEDIQVTGTMDTALDDPTDFIHLSQVLVIGDEYDSDVAGTTLAINTDDSEYDICDECNGVVIEGDWGVDTLTFSYSVGEVNDSVGPRTFAPGVQVVLEIEMFEDGDDAGDASADVTFFLSGATLDDITITAFEDQTELNP